VVASVRELLVYIYRKLTDQEPFEPLTPAQSGVRIRGLIGGRKIEAVLFDLDGVLTPINWSVAEWAAIYFPWLDRVVKPEQRKRFARTVMISIEGMVNFLINQMWRFELRKDLQRFLPLFNGLRGYPAADELLLTPGLADLLRTLAIHYRLGLISTRERKELHCFLERNGLDDGLFAVTLAREDVRNILPNSEPLQVAATHLGLAPDQLLMVSDTDTNLRAGRAMAMSTAGVLTGLGREPDMLDADLTLAQPADLLEWL
jgi:pyrophosphatase PpaX